MSKVRFGIIGAGGWGEIHAQIYSMYPFSELIAVCDIREEKAEEVAKRYGIKKFYTDYRALLSDNEIEAVAVVTPDFAHAEIAIAALESGKHLLLEKPMAKSVGDCERIISAVEKSGTKFMVDFHNRWNPPFVKAKRSLDKGELGKVRLIYSRLNDTIFVPTEMLSWADRSSPLWFVGSHSIDTIMWFLGDRVTRVYSVSRSEVLSSMGIETPDFYEIVMELEGGAVAVVENCWLLPNSSPNIVDVKFEAIGDRGVVYIDVARHRALEKYTESGGSYPDVLVIPEIYGKPQGFAAESIRHFVDCVAFDREPLVGLRDGLEVTRVIVAAERSAATGAPVELG